MACVEMSFAFGEHNLNGSCGDVCCIRAYVRTSVQSAAAAKLLPLDIWKYFLNEHDIDIVNN